MKSHARLATHPIHPMLVMFPTALFPLLLLADLLYLAFEDATFWTAGFWLAALGVLATLAAMVPGIVDMRAIPDGTKAHRTGLWHAITGTTLLVAYAAATWIRWPAGSGPENFALALGVDVVGTILVAAQGWLGGELVYKHHVGVPTEREGAEPVPLLKRGETLPMPEGPRRTEEERRRRDVGP